MSTEKGILEQSKVLKVIMTTRKAANGEKAKQELLKSFSAADVDRVIIAELDLGRDPRTPTGLNRSEIQTLNEFEDPLKGSTESIDKFSVWLKETYGGYNVLVNNAGIASELNQDEKPHLEKLVDTVNTNFSGTAYVSWIFMCQFELI